MLNRPITLLLLGTSFAAGMSIANLSKSSGTSNATAASVAQEKGSKAPKPGAKEADDEGSIKFADVPEAVRSAILKLTPEKSVKKIAREGADGMTVYAVEYDAKGIASSVDLSEKGIVMELEKEIKASELPEPAMTALKKKYPDAKTEVVRSVQAFFYEAEIITGGTKHEVKLYSSGKIE